MKEEFNHWLNQSVPVAGVLACGVRHADDSAFSRAFDPAFTGETLENAWRCVGDAFQVLKLNRLPTAQACWTYEKALLFCAMRADGLCLAVFTRKEAEALDAEGLSRMFAEFQALGAA